MLAAFSSHREPSGMVRARIQSALNALADCRVFVLDPLSYFCAWQIALPRLDGKDVSKVEIKDALGLVHTSWNDEVGVENPVVPVDHKIGIDPVVQSAISCANGTRLRLSAFTYKWTPLQTEVFAVLDQVVAVVKHAIEAFVQVRDVITTVEVIVDEHFPITLKLVVSPLKPMKIVKLEWTDLLN